MVGHQAEFHERIARIKAGEGFTKSTIYVGLETAFTYVPAARSGHKGLRQLVKNAAYALSFPFCMLLGFLGHALGQYADFVLSGLPDPNVNVDIEMVRVAATGFAITAVAAHLMGLREKGLLVPKLLGVASGMLLFHNLVHLLPQVFEVIFSPIWVAKITGMTEPHSLYWRGISIPF